MRTIYINGKFFCQQTTGTQRYAHELLYQFDKLLSEETNEELTIEILVPPAANSMPRYTNLQVRTVGRTSGTAWEQLDLPRFCNGKLLFTLSGGAPIFYPRNVVTIHDAAVVASPAGYSRTYRMWHATVCKRMAHKAEHIFTVSNFSKSEIMKWYGAPAERITVTYLGSEHFSRVHADSSALGRFGIQGKYILAAGVRNPNKNFDRIMQSVSRDCLRGIPLVVAGGHDRKVYGATTESDHGVCRLGHVSDEELKALYENAACFVFASLYEGFGLPPLEAMASGCPVVVSRVASLPELFNGATFFCDPYDPDDIAASIQHAIQAPPSAERLKQFAGTFSWERCARETLEKIRSLA